MAAIRFEAKHEAKGWSFVLEHADDAYFRKDRVILVDPPLIRELEEAGIPFQLVNGSVNREAPIAKRKAKKATVRSKK